MPEDDADDWPPSETEEKPSEDESERSPVGAMDRDPGELGPDEPRHSPDSGSSSGGNPGDGDAAGDEHAAGADEEEAPLADLREELSERGEAEDDEFEELFEEIDVGTVDEESVWDQLSETADEPLFTAEPEEVPEADVTVVEKRLCHSCPHFGDPPELHCTHEGTTIDAEVDTDHFRVVNCPIVAQRAEMEASDFSSPEG